MRTAITLGIHHGGEIVELLAAFPTPLDEQRTAFKALRAETSHEKFETIELWDSGSGRLLRHKFKEPAATVPEKAPEPAPEKPAKKPAKVPKADKSAPTIAPAVEVPAAPEGDTEAEAPGDVDGFQVGKPRKTAGK